MSMGWCNLYTFLQALKHPVKNCNEVHGLCWFKVVGLWACGVRFGGTGK